MYQGARHVDTEIGKWCAKKFLNAGNLIGDGVNDGIIPSMGGGEQKKYEIALEKGTTKLVKRLFSMVDDGHIPILSAIPKGVVSFFL